MANQLAPSQQRIFMSLYSLSVISLIAFAVLFFILCSTENLSQHNEKDVKARDLNTHPVLGQFGSTGASIIIIGMPLLFILLTWLYLQAYRN
jgi:hypothetical protein